MLKFDEVWSENQQNYLSADYVLNELDHENPLFQNDIYYCPSCKQAILTPVIYTDNRKKHFRKLKDSFHEEGCNFEVTSIPKQYVIKYGVNPQVNMSEQEKRSLLNRYRLKTHENEKQRTNKTINNSSSNNRCLSKPHQYREMKQEIPKAKLDRYFKNKIFEIYQEIPTDDKILYLIYGNIYITPVDSNQFYNNYQIRLSKKDGSYSVLCSIGLNKTRELDKIQYIEFYLNRPVHAVMIGYLSMHHPFLNFNLLSGNSLKLENL